MGAETFEVMNEKEQLLKGIIETEHPRKKQPVVIFLNGFLDTMETPVKKEFVKDFLKDGFVTVRFDYTHGFGAGSGDAAEFTITGVAEDATAVIEYATRRGYVDGEHIILVGHCFGSMAALLLAAFDERVKALLLMSTPYDFQDTNLTRVADREMSRIKLKRYFHIFSDNLGKEVRIDYTFFEDAEKKDMARATRNLKQPLLLVHGRQDESIPVANSQEVSDRVAGVHELVVLEGMKHHPTVDDAKEIYKLMRKFLKKHLKL